MFELSDTLRDRFSGDDLFAEVMEMEGEVFRAKEGRRTIRFQHGGKDYFAKIHHGIGWGEVFKNLSSLRLPVIDASNEWLAVKRLNEVGVATVNVVGKGARGWNPACRESFVIMDALEETVEVEDFLKGMGGLVGAKKLALKRAIIRTVADAARRMHGAGMNHRDFYLCHFHIKDQDWSEWRVGEPIRLPLLDLHRAQIRQRVPRRWLVKDLGALLFSAFDCRITSSDIVAFLKVYLGDQWREALAGDVDFWRAVVQRASGFYRRHRGETPQLPRVLSMLG